MRKFRFAAGAAGALFISVIASGSASAQTADWPPGAELRGAAAQVEFADGVVNNVNFNPDGTATITGPGGSTANANWFVQGQQLCLQTGTGRECWPYQMAFQTGQSLTLTSDCGSTSRWTALSTQQPPVRRSGERG
ncbi:MAG TPA: hypothetical protein VFO69_00900 [Allosphingosinicella sp.]|nr:hypothetical protein [Allosphingosinicella sp.]